MALVEMGSGNRKPFAGARMLAFKIGGKATLPPMPPVAPVPPPPPLRYSEEQVRAGEALFARTCQICHGTRAMGGLKDLRHMDAATHREFNDIVLKGTRKAKGMAGFADVLTPAETDSIHAYVIARANEDWNNQ